MPQLFNRKEYVSNYKALKKLKYAIYLTIIFRNLRTWYIKFLILKVIREIKSVGMLTMWRAENHLFSSDKIFCAQQIGVFKYGLA